MGIRRRRGVRPGAGGSVPGQIDSASGWGGGGGFVLGKDPNTDVRVPYVVNVLSCAEASVFLPHLINLITSHPPPPWHGIPLVVAYTHMRSLYLVFGVNLSVAVTARDAWSDFIEFDTAY